MPKTYWQTILTTSSRTPSKQRTRTSRTALFSKKVSTLVPVAAEGSVALSSLAPKLSIQLSSISNDTTSERPSPPDLDINKAIDDFLRENEALVLPFVTETRLPPAWKPDLRHVYSQDWLEKMEHLNIPLWDRKPSMLLHKLGNFQNNLILRDRLAKIFVAGRQK